MYQLDVGEMIDAFGPTYQTIDIRSAAVKQEGQWANVYAVLRLSYEEPAVVESRLAGLVRNHGSVHTKSFRVFLGQRPFSDWSDLTGELARGRMRVGDIEIKLAQPLTDKLLQERAYIQSDYSSIRPFDSYNWPVAQYYLFSYNSVALMQDALVREVARLGYPDPYEAVNLLCELNVRAGSANRYQFCLSLPVFASITGFRILSKEKQALVEIRSHRELPSLKGMVIFRERNVGMEQPPKYRLPIERFSAVSECDPFVTAMGSVALPGIEEDGWAEAHLLHPELGEVHHESNLVRSLIPSAERNVLFEALKFFCPETELKSLVVRPFEKQGPRLKLSAAFELRVAWILSLLGLSTIVLGEYEHIVVQNTNVQRGSADILAASQREKKLVVVACTIGPPKDEDFSNLLTTAEILAREVYADTNVQILPLVCTTAPAYPASRDSGDGLRYVPVLDADRLGLLFKLIKLGREREFFSFLETASFPEFGDPE